MKNNKILIGVIVFLVLGISALAFALSNNGSDVTVTFDTNGGSEIAKIVIKKGETVNKPANPTKSNYTFDVWKLEGTIYNFDTKVEKDITLVATWKSGSTNVDNKKTTWTVSFNTDGGTVMNSLTVNDNEALKTLITPVKDGYTFKEWTLDGITFDVKTLIKKDITLKAVYVKNAEVVKPVEQPTQQPNTPVKPQQPTQQPNPPVQPDLPTPPPVVQKSYTVGVARVDDYSPDRTLTVYEDGTAIGVSKIMRNNTVICYGSNLTVNYSELENVTTLKVTLTNGDVVNATVLTR